MRKRESNLYQFFWQPQNINSILCGYTTIVCGLHFESMPIKRWQICPSAVTLGWKICITQGKGKVQWAAQEQNKQTLCYLSLACTISCKTNASSTHFSFDGALRAVKRVV